MAVTFNLLVIVLQNLLRTFLPLIRIRHLCLWWSQKALIQSQSSIIPDILIPWEFMRPIQVDRTKIKVLSEWLIFLIDYRVQSYTLRHKRVPCVFNYRRSLFKAAVQIMGSLGVEPWWGLDVVKGDVDCLVHLDRGHNDFRRSLRAWDVFNLHYFFEGLSDIGDPFKSKFKVVLPHKMLKLGPPVKPRSVGRPLHIRDIDCGRSELRLYRSLDDITLGLLSHTPKLFDFILSFKIFL